MTYSGVDIRPIFVQIAERIEEDIVSGRLAEEAQVPSTNTFATLYQINPATAARGVNLLVERGMVYKKRGMGMFVATGSRQRLMEQRRHEFFPRYVATMLQEADNLGITNRELFEMLRKRGSVIVG